MIENKNGLLRQEIDDFYQNCPEECEVIETRIFVAYRYITIKCEYVPL